MEEVYTPPVSDALKGSGARPSLARAETIGNGYAARSITAAVAAANRRKKAMQKKLIPTVFRLMAGHISKNNKDVRVYITGKKLIHYN